MFIELGGCQIENSHFLMALASIQDWRTPNETRHTERPTRAGAQGQGGAKIPVGEPEPRIRPIDRGVQQTGATDHSD